jgi:phytoene/squalene synthetase
MHLCGVRPAGEAFLAPLFDPRREARALALFSYLVHIMRDFEKDQRQNLTYFAESLLARHGLERTALREIARGRPPDPSFRSLMADYRAMAEYYRRRARRTINSVRKSLADRYQLSLEMIYGLYCQIFERIDTAGGNFSEADLNPSPDAIQARIQKIINDFAPSKE